MSSNNGWDEDLVRGRITEALPPKVNDATGITNELMGYRSPNTRNSMNDKATDVPSARHIKVTCELGSPLITTTKQEKYSAFYASNVIISLLVVSGIVFYFLRRLAIL